MRLGLVFALIVAGCAAAEAVNESASDVSETPDAAVVDESQMPATLTTAGIERWLDAGHFEAWACSAIRPSRPPGGTTPMRVCSNRVLSSHGAGEYPIGSVDVRVLYDNTETHVIGRAVIVKTKAGGGEAWYWYERRNGTLNASAFGNASQARPCVQCHMKAKPSLFGHDLVFNQTTPYPSPEGDGAVGGDAGHRTSADGEGD